MVLTHNIFKLKNLIEKLEKTRKDVYKRQGPLELADMIGLDILLNVMNVMDKEIGAKYHPSLLLRKTVSYTHLDHGDGQGALAVDAVLYKGQHHVGDSPGICLLYTSRCV